MDLVEHRSRRPNATRRKSLCRAGASSAPELFVRNMFVAGGKASLNHLNYANCLYRKMPETGQNRFLESAQALPHRRPGLSDPDVARVQPGAGLVVHGRRGRRADVGVVVLELVGLARRPAGRETAPWLGCARARLRASGARLASNSHDHPVPCSRFERGQWSRSGADEFGIKNGRPSSYATSAHHRSRFADFWGRRIGRPLATNPAAWSADRLSGRWSADRLSDRPPDLPTAHPAA